MTRPTAAPVDAEQLTEADMQLAAPVKLICGARPADVGPCLLVKRGEWVAQVPTAVAARASRRSRRGRGAA